MSPGGQELYKKEITGIDIASQDQLNLTETFVFSTSETGIFKLEYAYDDETFSDNLHFRESQVLYYWPSISLHPDKPSYNYMDTANIGVTVNGVGSYLVQFNCPEAWVSETRTVVIPAGSSNTTEIFQVPIGNQVSYIVIMLYLVTDKGVFPKNSACSNLSQ